MITNRESTSRNLARSLSMGVLLSLVFFYAIHFFGTWKLEHYRPDLQTTETILLHNKCALLGDAHTLRPNTDLAEMEKDLKGVKMTGSFMTFMDGHIPALVVLAVVLGGVVFMIRKRR